jgi:hypothetical protein
VKQRRLRPIMAGYRRLANSSYRRVASRLQCPGNLTESELIASMIRLGKHGGRRRSYPRSNRTTMVDNSFPSLVHALAAD